MEEKETGYTHDYTRKSGVIYSEIFLPANVPQEYQNREILWNEVQKVEKKSDAQLAREIEVALPVELSREEQITLLQKYIAENFTSAGMCADMAIHEKHVDGKTVLHQNPHAHILLTTRGFKEDGSWAPKEKKTYALDENGERIPLMDENTGLQKLGKRNERLQRLRSAGNAGTDGANAGGTDGKDTDHTSVRERTTAASDLIRMAERAGADARANDAASEAVIKDSQTGRAYREAERERQDSERQRKIKARKRGIDR